MDDNAIGDDVGDDWMIVLAKALWYPNEGKGSVVDLTDALNFSNQDTIEIKNNTASLQLKNSWKEHIDINDNVTFVEGDVVKIYAKNDESGAGLDLSDTSNDLLMSTVVREWQTMQGEGSNALKLKLMDKSFIMLNRLWSNNYKQAKGWTAPTIIRDVVRNVTDLSGDGKFAVFAELVSQGGFIEDTRPDGSAFPAISYPNLLKPVFEWVRDLSQMENTNSITELETDAIVCGRPFRMYIDQLNRLHWFYPTSTADISIAAGTDNVRSVNLTKSIFEVTNQIIFDAGTDMRGITILGHYFDSSSDAKSLNQTHVPMTDISKKWKARDIEEDKNRVGFSRGTDDYPDTYPMTPVWLPTKSYTGTVGSDSAYNKSLWERCINDGTFRAKNIMMGLAHARWKGNIKLLGQRFITGNLINYLNTDIGHNNTLIRITSRVQTVNRNGWTTSLEVEQDQKVIEALTTA